MHSYEDRIRAVRLYYRYGKKASVVVMELGYPSTKQPGRWVRIYEEKGDLPRELKPRERYSRTCSMAETGLVSRWKNLSASWTGTYAGITRSVSSYH